MQQNDLTPEQSLNIITDAIHTSSEEKGDAAYYFTLWGALLTLFYALSFVNDYSGGIPYFKTLAWLVYPIGGILSFLHTRRTDARERAKPLHDSLYMYVWGGVALCLAVTSFFGNISNQAAYIPVLLLLFGLASFITGGVTKFRPLLAGGVLSIAGAAVAFCVVPLYHNMIAAVGIAVATLAPGILLGQRNKRN